MFGSYEADDTHTHYPFFSFKAPLRRSNFEERKSFLQTTVSLIQSIQLSNGQTVLSTRQKTGPLGLIHSIRSIIFLTEDMFQNETCRYILTYSGPFGITF